MSAMSDFTGKTVVSSFMQDGVWNLDTSDGKRLSVSANVFEGKPTLVYQPGKTPSEVES